MTRIWIGMTVSDLKFTNEQILAMELRDRNLLVSAAAGAGKTSVLVERIVRMALDGQNPVGIDRMLVVTFTKAAASEMKERIRKALYRELTASPMDRNIRRQLIFLNYAYISTIHSFCSEVIKSNYHMLDIDPAFIVSDEMESGFLLDKAIEEVLEDSYERSSAGFRNLVDSFGRGKDDSGLINMIADLYAFLRSMPDYLLWMNEKTSEYSKEYGDFSITPWGQVLISHAISTLEGQIAEIKAAKEVNEAIGGPEGYALTAADDISLLQDVSKNLNSGSWNLIAETFRNTKFGTLQRAAKGTPDEIKNIFKGSRNNMKSAFSKIASYFSGSSETIMENLLEMKTMFECLNGIIHKTDELYMDLKRKRGILDYNDLEHLALQCLTAEAGEMYRRKFMEVFIDEYQDSNPIQEKIIGLVSGRDREEKNVFMVGDLKQSIYRFRHAEPKLFQKKYDRFSDNPESKEVRIELSKNYRSRRQILDFCNMIFGRIMTRASCGIDYSGKAVLTIGADYSENETICYGVDLRIVCTNDKEIYDPGTTNDEKEAAVVGMEIIRLIDSGFKIRDRETGMQRPLEYRDIAILMRSVKGSADKFASQLDKMGIAAKTAGSSDFFGSYEIIIMTDFLRILDNPRQDIPLISVLRSSMFGFSDRELAAIKAASGLEYYFDCLKNYKGIGELEDKVNGFLESYEEYRRMSYIIPIDKFLWIAMNETGFYQAPVHSVDMNNARINLRRLFDLAGSYEKSNMNGIRGFLLHIRNMIERKKDISGTISGNNNSNEVNIMSIHKSKGLEFPVVILAGAGKSFNRNDAKEALLWERELGFGPDYIAYDDGYRIKTAAKKSLQVKGIMEDTREEMRILYVAMTRAREKLIITGSSANHETESLKWVLTGMSDGNQINAGKILSAGSHLDWIMACLSEQASGESIRKFANVPDSSVMPDEAEFSLRYVEPSEVMEALEYRSRGAKKLNTACNLSYEEISDRFSWQYPHEAEKGIHRKISVTELKKNMETADGGKDIFGYEFIEKPAFMDDDSGPVAAERGTLLHNVLAAMDYKKAADDGYIGELCMKAGVPEKHLEEYSNLIKKFLDSPLGRRVRSSPNAVTEKSFLYPIKTTRVYPEKEGLIDPDHKVMLQGIIDCLFFEDGNMIIIDYKSDNVKPGSEEAHAQRYRLQLELYSEAAQGLTGIGVGERYIYFLKTGESVRI